MVGEGDSGSDDQVLDGAGDQDLASARARGDALGDIDGGAVDAVAFEADFAGVDPDSRLDAVSRGIGTDCCCAPDRLAGRVERSEDAVRDACAQTTAVGAHVLRCRDVTHPLCEQDRGEDAGRSDRGRCRCEELFDLREQAD